MNLNLNESWLDKCEPDMDFNGMNEARVGDQSFMFTSGWQDEPGDEHFDDQEQIRRDRDDAWEELGDRMKRRDPSHYDNYNNNVKGEEMKPITFSTGKKSENYYGYPGLGYLRSMSAQSNNPKDKWFGQTHRGTEREFLNAANSWFPADFDDTQYSDSNYKVDKYGDVNESKVKTYIKSIVREAIEGINEQQLVIQTRTGVYLIDSIDDSVSYDENTLILSCLVGRSVVSIMIDKSDYQNLVNTGQACDGQYRILGKGGASTPENPCTLSVYNG